MPVIISIFCGLLAMIIVVLFFILDMLIDIAQNLNTIRRAIDLNKLLKRDN